MITPAETLRRQSYRPLPFHHEKTPSFVVSPARNIFKCFGCGKGGNVAIFLMEHEGFTFPEALRWLARKYHIEIQLTQPPLNNWQPNRKKKAYLSSTTSPSNSSKATCPL
ncbi:MAG: hypothetical protein H6577_27635 [Lewinellaceae bacterium]|nr:hypothetical protein [Lewinellaceae bacterium]